LLSLLASGESDRVEFKGELSGNAHEKLCKAICGFSNDLPGHNQVGVAFVGVTDNGKPSGLAITDELLVSLSNIRTDAQIVPPPTMTVSKLKIQSSEVAVIQVQPAQAPPVSYKGKIWVRVGPTVRVASKQDENILNEKRRYKDAPFDIHPIPSEISDLDRRYYEAEYLPATVDASLIEANDRTYAQRLSTSKMISSATELVPTVLGHLIIGSRTRDFLSGAYIQFLKFDGTDMSCDIVDSLELDGRVSDIFRRLDDKLYAHNTVAVDFKSNDLERRQALYPIVALQQLLRNAVLHRTYENTNAPVKLSWFTDRIEIWSPGGPYGVVNAENFGRPGFADYRNPNLAEAMKGLGLVQRFGVGIQSAQKALSQNGNGDASFEVQPTAVNVVIKKAQ
jgi:ATP-dependent DNA helicase RecG